MTLSIQSPIDINTLKRQDQGPSTTMVFRFNINDPFFRTQTIIINPSQPEYLAHAFVTAPIYDINTNEQIGYKNSDNYIQQAYGQSNTYLIRLNNTYLFNDGSTVSWIYSFVNNQPNPYYLPGTLAQSTCTGKYSKGGTVSLQVNQDGSRVVTLILNL